MPCARIHDLDGKLVCDEVFSHFALHLKSFLFTNLQILRRVTTMWWKMKKYFKCILQWCRKMQNNILKKYWRSGETSTDMETWQRDYLTGTGWVGTIFWVKRFYNRVIVARCTLRFSRPPLSGWLSTKPPFYAFPRFALFLFKSWLQYNNATLHKWNPSLSIHFMQRNCLHFHRNILSAWVTATCHWDQVGYW